MLVTKKNNLSFLASVIKEERKRANLTQEKLAKITGLGLKTIRKIEQDDDSVAMKNVKHLLYFFGLELGPKKLVRSSKKKIDKEISKNEVLLTLKNILPIFKTKYGVTALGLFGSLARGEAQKESDIDILFEGNTDFSSEGEMLLILEHLFCGYKVDLTNKAHIDSRFETSIIEDVIYVEEEV